MPSRTSPASPPTGLTAAPVAELGAAEAPARAAQPPRRLSSDAVFDGAVEVLICHRGTDYRLRQTTLGKLILTK